MNKDQPENVTVMLERARKGDDSAITLLLPVIYDELRALAGSIFKQQRVDHTLQPTALVHEAYVKLVNQESAQWNDRCHFFAVAGKAMRQILTDHARGKDTEKRGGGWKQITLDGDITPITDKQLDLIDLDRALTALEALNERHARIVELRFLAGLKIEEVAEVIGVSRRTVELDWRAARAWLRRELSR